MHSHNNQGHHNQLIPFGSGNYKNSWVVDYSSYERAARLIFLSLIAVGSISSIGLLYRAISINRGVQPAISLGHEYAYTPRDKVTDAGSLSPETIQPHKVKSIRIPTH